MRSVTGLYITFDNFVNDYIPTLWNTSSFDVESLLFTGLGGIAGIWVGVRLSE